MTTLILKSLDGTVKRRVLRDGYRGVKYEIQQRKYQLFYKIPTADITWIGGKVKIAFQHKLPELKEGE